MQNAMTAEGKSNCLLLVLPMQPEAHLLSGRLQQGPTMLMLRQRILRRPSYSIRIGGCRGNSAGDSQR